MLLNYLKLAIRLLIRNPFFTLINVMGLSIGFAAFLGLWQYSAAELKSDQYHPGYDRIARLCVDWRWTDDGETWDKMFFAWFPPDIGQEIKQDFPEIESTVRILPQEHFSNQLVEHGNQIVVANERPSGKAYRSQETKAAYADPNLFDFFSIPLIYGDKKTVLRNQNSVVLSEKTARKYFGSDNPTGKLLVMNNQVPLTVTGVFEDLPGNTHLEFDFVISNVQHINKWNGITWGAAYGYVKLNRKGALSHFKQKLNEKNKEYFAKALKVWPNVTAQIFVQTLAEIPFNSGFAGDYFVPKSRSMLLILAAVGIIVLLMAWINYINLALARMKKRMKEVGTRKMAGAGTADFLKQFLTESLLVNLISVGVAFTVLQILRVPAENWLQLTAPKWDGISLPSILFFLMVILSGVLITGLYPAYMSVRYNPRALVLAGTTQRAPNWFAGCLTTLQYTSAVVLMVGTLIIAHQFSFILNKGIGILQHHVGIIESPTIHAVDLDKKIENFKVRVLSSPHVLDAATSRSVPGHRGENMHLRTIGSEIPIGIDCHGGVNENYLPFYEIRLLAGRNFVRDDRSDVILLSRTVVERLGYKNYEDAIGVHVMVQLPDDATWIDAEIIGVIQDYRTGPYLNFSENNTQYSTGRGIILTYKDYMIPEFIPNRLAVKVDGAALQKTISEIKMIYDEIFPGDVFVFYFLDDYIAKQYHGQRTSRNQVIFFTALAMGIACLGLLGIISNTVVEKTKEIGIRKTLGARSMHIGAILLRATGRQMAISVLVGVPLSWYLTGEYLQIFSERISMQWWHVVVAIATMFFIMIATVSSILIKAARTNPVESLRYE